MCVPSAGGVAVLQRVEGTLPHFCNYFAALHSSAVQCGAGVTVST